MRTEKELMEIREELTAMLAACEPHVPEPLWQLSDWCITMQSIIDIESRILKSGGHAR